MHCNCLGPQKPSASGCVSGTMDLHLLTSYTSSCNSQTCHSEHILVTRLLWHVSGGLSVTVQGLYLCFCFSCARNGLIVNCKKTKEMVTDFCRLVSGAWASRRCRYLRVHPTACLGLRPFAVTEHLKLCIKGTGTCFSAFHSQATGGL